MTGIPKPFVIPLPPRNPQLEPAAQAVLWLLIRSTMIIRPLLGLALLGGYLPSAHAAADLIRPKVVVVTMFEPGADTGDTPGEFQF